MTRSAETMESCQTPMPIRTSILLRTVPALLGVACCLSAEGDRSSTAGQKYLEKLAVRVEEEAPFEVIVGVYCGRKWLSHFTLAASKAPAGSGGVLQLDVVSRIQRGGQVLLDTSRQLLDQKWSTVRLETEIEIESVTMSRFSAVVLEGRWTGTLSVMGQARAVEGDAGPGACWGPRYLPWILAPDEEVALDEIGPNPRAFEYAADVEPHRGHVAHQKSELRRGHLTEDGTDYLVLLNDSGQCIEMRAFEGTVVRFLRILPDQIGKDIEGPLDLTESQETILRAALALQRGDREEWASQVDFESMISDVAKAATGDERRRMVEEVRTKAIEHAFVDAGRRDPVAEVSVRDEVATHSLAAEAGDRAVVRMYDQVYKLHRISDDKGEDRWLIVHFEKSK